MRVSPILTLSILLASSLLLSAPAAADDIWDTSEGEEDEDEDDDDDDDDDDKGCASAAGPVSAGSVLVGLGLVMGMRRREDYARPGLSASPD
jgi:hypothetical protein